MSSPSSKEESSSLSSSSNSLTSLPSSPPTSRATTGIAHQWYKKHFSSPVYCNTCKDFLWGLGSQGYSCEVCKYVAHGKCRAKSPLNCIAATTPKRRSATKLEESTEDLTIVAEEEGRKGLSLTEHHWIEGNLSLGKKCKVCRNGFSFKGFDGVSCSKCNGACHKGCLAKMDQPCTPKHATLMFDEDYSQKHDGPLIAFINPKSGGQDGPFIFRKLKRLLSAGQVFDMTQGGPEPGLSQYVGIPNLRILVCGGDGTVCWVLSVLDKMKVPVYPAIGVLPMGTGNDLARALDWGGGYSKEPLSPILRRIEKADIIEMDRWKLDFAAQEPPSETSDSDGGKKQLIMNNYFSIGVDAKVALKFHQLREEKPQYFKMRLVNKGWYGKFGLETMMSAPDQLESFVELKIDGQTIPLSKDFEGLIVQNVPSYAAGCNMWGKEKGKFEPQSMSDGLLEVIAITGTFQMGRIRVGMGHGYRLGQSANIQITTSKPVPAQIDGEPWMLPPSDIRITHFNKVNMLQRRKGKGKPAEVSPSSPRTPQILVPPAEDGVESPLAASYSYPTTFGDSTGPEASTAHLGVPAESRSASGSNSSDEGEAGQVSLKGKEKEKDGSDLSSGSTLAPPSTQSETSGSSPSSQRKNDKKKEKEKEGKKAKQGKKSK